MTTSPTHRKQAHRDNHRDNRDGLRSADSLRAGVAQGSPPDEPVRGVRTRLEKPKFYRTRGSRRRCRELFGRAPRPNVIELD